MQAEAGQVGAVAVPTDLPDQAILVLAVEGSGVAPTDLPGQANLAGHQENHLAGHLGNLLVLVLESPTGSWPGRRSTCGQD